MRSMGLPPPFGTARPRLGSESPRPARRPQELSSELRTVLALATLITPTRALNEQADPPSFRGRGHMGWCFTNEPTLRVLGITRYRLTAYRSFGNFFLLPHSVASHRNVFPACLSRTLASHAGATAATSRFSSRRESRICRNQVCSPGPKQRQLAGRMSFVPPQS